MPPSRSPISGWWASQVCLPIAAVGQTFPPVAVLAIAVPVMGFGQQPAIIALILYGVLPILQATLAGLGAVPASVMSVASGMGMIQGALLVALAAIIIDRLFERLTRVLTRHAK